MKYKIEAKNFIKSFKKNIVGPFNLQVNPGKIHAIIGLSGSGKTVFIKSLIRGINSFKGTISINGKNNKNIKVKHSIGYVPEFITFPENITAYQFLRYMGKLSGVKGKKLKNRIEDLMTKLGIWEHRNKNVNAFSSGMKKRVMIIQGLLHDPDIVILDEPEAGLDITNRRIIMEYLKFLASQKKTIFLSSHLLNEVKYYLDEFTLVLNGKQFYSGSIAPFGVDSSYFLMSDNDWKIIDFFIKYNIPYWYEEASQELNFVLNNPLSFLDVMQYAEQMEVTIYKISESNFSIDFLLQKLNKTGVIDLM
ncbi:ABC transporter ATP-binding protein [Spiroplasma endosymbiont of Lonchoptera lutea]|uniref:ABC transporter ATP-binding protein n=1 Tax=Spiroplasma endosymbiont of Lonchoptera lutea TaxID=3066297 RepID=UPI0030CB5DF5